MTQTLYDYVDITDELIKNAKPNSHKVLNSYFYIGLSAIYIVDGKKVVLDYSKKELEVAKWIENTFGGELYMNPRVNSPDGVKTADYWWDGEYWDLKVPIGNSKRTIENIIKDSKDQARNFIIDISFSSINLEEAIRQISYISFKK